MAGKTVAAIDMGTNSFHMIVAKSVSNGRFCVVESRKEYVRLGTKKFIDADAETRAVEAMKMFRRVADVNKVEKSRVVATAAVREAHNKLPFLEHIKSASGFDVDVISGEEEARLIYLGVLQALPVYNKVILTVDIGGGSTEFVLGSKGKVLFRTSLKLGHIRLAVPNIEKLDRDLQECEINKLRDTVHSLIASSELVDNVKKVGFEMAIGSSGTIESVYQAVRKGYACEIEPSHMMVPTLSQSLKLYEFTKQELDSIYRKLHDANYNEQNASQLGFPKRPISSIVTGLVLLQEICETLGIDKMTISPYAVREGVIAEMLAISYDDCTFASRVRWNSALLIAWKFNSKKKVESDIRSVQLAKELLESLQRYQEDGKDCFSIVGVSIDSNDIELMETSILLHRIGMSISTKGYHKHSYYIIKNTGDLSGYNSKERELISFLARYHRKKFPSSKHGCFSRLPNVVQKKIRALSVIVRIAVLLGQSNSCTIENMDVCHADKQYTIVLKPYVDPITGSERDISSQILEAQFECKHFEEVFKRKLSITVSKNLCLHD